MDIYSVLSYISLQYPYIRFNCTIRYVPIQRKLNNWNQPLSYRLQGWFFKNAYHFLYPTESINNNLRYYGFYIQTFTPDFTHSNCLFLQSPIYLYTEIKRNLCSGKSVKTSKSYLHIYNISQDFYYKYCIRIISLLVLEQK